MKVVVGIPFNPLFPSRTSPYSISPGAIRHVHVSHAVLFDSLTSMISCTTDPSRYACGIRCHFGPMKQKPRSKPHFLLHIPTPPPLSNHLDGAVLRSRDLPSCSEVMKVPGAKIRRKLGGKTGKRIISQEPLQCQFKDRWVKNSRGRLQNEVENYREQAEYDPHVKKIISKWANQKVGATMESPSRLGPYLRGKQSQARASPKLKLHQSLRKSGKAHRQYNFAPKK